ncbi:MAG: PDZ domain-containing protein [Spirochaetaceae bacterium]|nr:PDZ domain-containing protein [Spirochaetaceae bacterium]
MSKHGDSVVRETTESVQGHRPQTGRFRVGIRKYKKSVIFGCAAVAAALVVLPAAARTWHGLWTNDAETGALVATVDPDGPAGSAGLQRGDIIVGVDGTAIENHRDFLDAIGDNAVDDTLGLELRRGNERVTLSVTVGANVRGPYLGLLIVPGGAGAFQADTFGDLQERRGRGFRGRGAGRGGWHRGMPSQQNQDKLQQQNTSAVSGGSI